MDWYVINYLYPQAFKKFSDIMFPNVGVPSLNTLQFFDAKKLYQFFDKEGIYLTTEMYNPNQWVFNISLQNGIVLGPMKCSSPNREECEVNGFVECFKLLDKILS